MKRSDAPSSPIRHTITIRQEDRDAAARILAMAAAEDDGEAETSQRAGWSHMQNSRGWR